MLSFWEFLEKLSLVFFKNPFLLKRYLRRGDLSKVSKMLKAHPKWYQEEILFFRKFLESEQTDEKIDSFVNKILVKKSNTRDFHRIRK